MSNQRLLSDPVHFTNLRNMNRSPAHYKASVLEPREPSSAMRFGRVVHAVLLGWPSYAVWDGTRRGAAWDRFVEFATLDTPDTLIITKDELDRAMRCCDAVGGSADATRLLVGKREVELGWTTLGRECAGRADVLGNGYVTELKTTSNAHPTQFIFGALRLNYHAQLAAYLDGAGMPDGDGHIVAVETAPPFAVTVFTLTRRCLDAGRKLYRLWMEQLLQCEAADAWPAYAQSIVPFDVPDYEGETLIIDGEMVDAA